MQKTPGKKSFGIPALFALLFVVSPSAADMSKMVTAAFRGQLVISKDELPEGKTDKDTIAKIKAIRLETITGQAQENVMSWRFNYTAFLKSTGAGSLKLEFLTTDAKPQLAATQNLAGIDPKSEILTGSITISEDDGPKKGKTYTLNLVGAKNQVVATTKLTLR